MLENVFNSKIAKIQTDLKSIKSEDRLNQELANNLIRTNSISHIKLVPTSDIKIVPKSQSRFLRTPKPNIQFDPNQPVNYYEISIPITQGIEVASIINMPSDLDFFVRDASFVKEDIPPIQPANLSDDQIVADFHIRIKKDVQLLSDIINVTNSKIDTINIQLSEFIITQIEARKNELKLEKENLKKINPFL